MMNKYVAYGLIFTAGLGIGGVVNHFIESKKYGKRLEEELLKNQDYYIKLLGYDLPGEKDIPKDMVYDEETVVKEVRNVEDDSKRVIPGSYTNDINERKAAFLRDHKKIRYDRRPDSEEQKDQEVDEVSLAVNNDNPDQDIQIITAEQYSKEHLAFEKTTLLWWEKNKLLTTEDYEILDVPDLIGTEWINRIGEFERDTVYVRNYLAETDYDICVQHDDYYDYAE